MILDFLHTIGLTNLSDAEVKRYCQISSFRRSIIGLIEKGTRNVPEVETVLALVAALRLKQKEAEELVEVAGYSPEVLQTGGRLAYDSPAISGSIRHGLDADLTRLLAALAKIPRHSQKPCIDALATFIEALYPVKE